MAKRGGSFVGGGGGLVGNARLDDQGLPMPARSSMQEGIDDGLWFHVPCSGRSKLRSAMICLLFPEYYSKFLAVSGHQASRNWAMR